MAHRVRAPRSRDVSQSTPTRNGIRAGIRVPEQPLSRGPYVFCPHAESAATGDPQHMRAVYEDTIGERSRERRIVGWVLTTDTVFSGIGIVVHHPLAGRQPQHAVFIEGPLLRSERIATVSAEKVAGKAVGCPVIALDPARNAKVSVRMGKLMVVPCLDRSRLRTRTRVSVCSGQCFEYDERFR